MPVANAVEVPNRWDASAVPSDAVEELVYASSLLGSDPRITNFGGGNTSSKIPMKDPVSGDTVSVLWVKASGGDLGSAKRTGFASLYQEKVVGLERRYKEEKLHEDEIVPLYLRCNFDHNPAAPSIDTPLHAFVPQTCVSHMHSDSVISIAASADSERLTREVFKGRLGYLPWKRPGFELGLMLRDLIEREPGIQGAMMGGHGFICWADDWKACYALTLDLVNLASEYIASHAKTSEPFGRLLGSPALNGRQILLDLLPKLRGKAAYEGKRLIASVDTSDVAIDFTLREKL